MEHRFHSILYFKTYSIPGVRGDLTFSQSRLDDCHESEVSELECLVSDNNMNNNVCEIYKSDYIHHHDDPDHLGDEDDAVLGVHRDRERRKDDSGCATASLEILSASCHTPATDLPSLNSLSLAREAEYPGTRGLTSWATAGRGQYQENNIKGRQQQPFRWIINEWKKLALWFDSKFKSQIIIFVIEPTNSSQPESECIWWLWQSSHVCTTHSDDQAPRLQRSGRLHSYWFGSRSTPRPPLSRNTPTFLHKFKCNKNLL